MPPVILIDGRFESSIGALDRGLAYGDGVFRTMRASAGRIHQWPRHYAKLLHDCARLAIPCPSEPLLLDDIRGLGVAERECVVKIIVTRGSAGRGYSPPLHCLPVRVVAAFPLPDIPADRGCLGITARWCRTQVSVQPALAGVKHLNRLDSVLARSEWADGEIDEGLMLDDAGRVIQGTMSNVFIIEGDRLATPVLDRAGVAGVQRDRLIAIARRSGLDCREERISPERVLAADQVLLTNSVIGMWWIARLDARCWPRLEITTSLLEHVLQTQDG